MCTYTLVFMDPSIIRVMQQSKDSHAHVFIKIPVTLRVCTPSKYYQIKPYLLTMAKIHVLKHNVYVLVMLLFITEDIWPDWDRSEGQVEPDWVVSEREQFFKHRDSDKDQRLSKVSIVVGDLK